MKCRRQGGSFVAEPFASGLLGLGAIGGTDIGQEFIQFGVALAGGFRNPVPFQRLNFVLRRALPEGQRPNKPPVE